MTGRSDGNGRFALTVDRDDEPLVEEACGESGEAHSIAIGDVDLAVSANGAWRLEATQQLDGPVREPSLGEMESIPPKTVGGAVVRAHSHRLRRRTSASLDLDRETDTYIED